MGPARAECYPSLATGVPSVKDTDLGIGNGCGIALGSNLAQADSVERASPPHCSPRRDHEINHAKPITLPEQNRIDDMSSRRRGYLTTLLGMVLGAAAVAAQAQVTYLGEFCWQGTDGEEPITLQLGVLSYGDRHFPVHGTLELGTETLPVHGNAQVINGAIEVDLSSFLTTFFFEVDPNTFSGTLFAAVVVPDAQGGATHTLTSDQMNPTTCPSQ